MHLSLAATADAPTNTTVTQLTDGVAENMGEGLFIIIQSDEFGKPQTVCLNCQDLKDMLSNQAHRDIAAATAKLVTLSKV